MFKHILLYTFTILYFLENTSLYYLPLMASPKRHTLRPVSTAVSERNSPAGHSYEEVTGREEERVLNQIIEQSGGGVREYMKRFLGHLKTKRYLLNLPLRDEEYIDSEEFIKALPLYADIVFQVGLLRDKNGDYWVVRRFKGGKRADKNVPENEMFTWLLFKGRANAAEVRFISESEVTGLGIFATELKKLRDYYLVRVVTKKNIPEEHLVHKQLPEAFSALFVGHTLLRKADPVFENFCYAGNVPVSIDNDYILAYDEVSGHEPEFKRFLVSYLYHALFKTVSPVIDKSKQSLHNSNARKVFSRKDRKVARFIDLEMKNPARTLYIAKDTRSSFGLGGGFMAAEMLDIEQIRKSIIEFKQIENVRELAKRAGYAGGASGTLEYAVDSIESNLRTLGRDVNETLKALTGKDYGLDELDKAPWPTTEPIGLKAQPITAISQSA